AVRATPENAILQADLAEAHFERFQEGAEKLATAGRFAAAARAVLAPVGFVAVPLPSPGGFAGQEEELARRHLAPALRHYLQARDLGPLMARPHVRLAASAGRLGKADTRQAYLRRAQRLRPYDADLWFIRGLQDLLDGRHEEAWLSWRRSLECSDRHLA